MLTPRCTPRMRLLSFLGTAIVFVGSSAFAQAHDSAIDGANSANASSFESSSASSMPAFALESGESSSSTSGIVPGSGALPGAPAASGSGAAAAGQAGGSDRGFAHHLVFEAGGGFNAPAGGDQQDYITYGGQFTAGAGYRFTRHVSALLEYQIIDDKLPGALIAETGANGGYAHIWSFTVAPVVDLFPKSTNDVYATGGGGFYRKVTSFTDPEETEYCYYFCGVGYTNAVVGHFSSNQGGWNIGGGFTHRLGGVYGDGRMKLFAEVRYLDVLTPAVSHLQPNGLSATSVAADTKLIPVTFGIRF
jgi:hypothetical protein